MSTRTPIIASVPYAVLPALHASPSAGTAINIDSILDDLDSESDSGFEDGSPGATDRKAEGRASEVPAIVETEEGSASATWFRPLADGPCLNRRSQENNVNEDGGDGEASGSQADMPKWMQWTSSAVTCTDTAFSSNEDRVDCIWLIAGCQDATIWVFCSVYALTQAEAGPDITSASTSYTPSDHEQRVYGTTTAPVSFAGQRSDHFAVRKANGSHPPSPGSSVSKMGGQSIRSSRAASMDHSRRHRSSHSGSISLAVHAGSMPASHGGMHTPVGRKASATVSVIDTDAFSQETLQDPVDSQRHISPPIRASTSSLSYEELPSTEPVDHRKVDFVPVVHIYPRCSHAPLVWVKLLPQEAPKTSFLCLTADGQLFKFAAADGMIINHLDLSKPLFPHLGTISLVDDHITYGSERPLIFANASATGLIAPVDLISFEALDCVKIEPQSHTAVIKREGIPVLLEIRPSGEVYTLGISTDASEASHRQSGHIKMPDDLPIVGVKVVDESVVIFSESHLQVTMLIDGALSIIRCEKNRGALRDVLVLSARRLALVFDSLVRFTPVDEETDSCLLLDFALSEKIESAAVLKQPTSTNDLLVLVARDSGKSRTISIAPVQAEDTDNETNMWVAYENRVCLSPPVAVLPTAARQVDDATLAIGYSNGKVRFETVDYDSYCIESGAFDAISLNGAICFLQVYRTPKRVYAIAGSTEGSIGIWDAYEKTLLAHFEVFNEPVLTLCETAEYYVAISAQGALAVLPASDIYQSPLLLSGSSHMVEEIFSRETQLVCFYMHGRARLWDVESGKMEKALTHTEALAIVKDVDGWTCLEFPKRKSAPALSTDFRQLIEEAASVAITSSQGGTLVVHPAVKWLLACHLIPAQEEYIQDALADGLGLEVADQKIIAFTSPKAASIFQQTSARGALKITQRVSAERLLIAVALLRIFLNSTETERPANEVIAYYATTLAEEPEPGQKDVSLDYLADFWQDDCNDLRQAARLLFGARVGRLTETEVVREVTDRQARMLKFQAGAKKELLVLGELAIAHEAILPSGTLRDIANQILKSLENVEDPISTSVALELCTRGFAVFQNYLDGVRALRVIFKIAVNSLPVAAAGDASPTQTPSTSNVRNLARQAVLVAASVNAPLFMTVLSIDAIQSDVDQEERAITLKLIAFMVRKKPVVLFAHLPRLVDAVVKSLDPRGTLRGALQQTATYILSELVKTYPSVAFHGKTQRLAVGTHEGACIVYDLKTATRLYILHSHHKRASAVSYSPDGRRLVTMSLEESNVKVWKVGNSFLGLLTPAGPPPQGHGSNSHEAYKTLEFKLASPEEAMMTAAAQLEWLNIEWLEERRVKISIRETALTFSVA